MFKRFLLLLAVFAALILPTAFLCAVLAAPPAWPNTPASTGCDRNLVGVSASLAALQARLKSLADSPGPEICTATRLYFLELVKARAVTALCKTGPERERVLGRFDSDVEHANDAIAARCN